MATSERILEGRAHRPQLERRKHGVALVTRQRLAPFGYVREEGGELKLKMKSGDEHIEFDEADLRRLADELAAMKAARVLRAR